jgi:hypothetical protein
MTETRVNIVYDNAADDADAVLLTGGTWTVPLSNLQDPRPSKKARSSGVGLSATQFNVDLGTSKTFRTLAVTHANLSASARYRITWYSDAFTTQAGTTGWLAIPGYPADDPDDIGAATFHLFDSDTSARYWLFEFDDQTNADGYVELGRLFMGTTWTPTYNFTEQNAEGVTPNTPRQDSLGGTGYFNRRKPVRYFRFTLGLIPEADYPAIRRLRKISNLDKQVIVIPDRSDTDNLNDRCFLGTIKTLPEMQLLIYQHATAGFEIVEAV